MKYIIMCGGNYRYWETPRHLTKICGEEIVERIIRLLKENGIKDIEISSNNPVFKKYGLPILNHTNSYDIDSVEGKWYDAFYLTDEPTCYIFGDVVFSPEAMKKVVETEVEDIELFGSAPPFSKDYFKDHIEAFALKVNNTDHLKRALEKTKQLDAENKFWRKPLIWELWTVIKNVPLQAKPDEYIYNYTIINDYTCDIDRKGDIIKIQKVLGGIEMIRCQVIEDFTLERFDELENIERKGVNTKGKLYVGDVFSCSKDLADYLLGDNRLKRSFVKVIEIVPQEQFEVIKQPQVKDQLENQEKKTDKKKKSKKSKKHVD